MIDNTDFWGLIEKGISPEFREKLYDFNKSIKRDTSKYVLVNCTLLEELDRMNKYDDFEALLKTEDMELLLADLDEPIIKTPEFRPFPINK